MIMDLSPRYLHKSLSKSPRNPKTILFHGNLIYNVWKIQMPPLLGKSPRSLDTSWVKLNQNYFLKRLRTMHLSNIREKFSCYNRKLSNQYERWSLFSTRPSSVKKVSNIQPPSGSPNLTFWPGLIENLKSLEASKTRTIVEPRLNSPRGAPFDNITFLWKS